MKSARRGCGYSSATFCSTAEVAPWCGQNPNCGHPECTEALALTFHQGWWLARGGARTAFRARILVPAYDNGPAVGPDGRGFHGSRVCFLARRDGLALVRGVAAARRYAATRR